MLALTLWRPWTEAIVRGPKRIENRTWMPPASVIQQVIAIHAGKRFEDLTHSTWPFPDGWAPPTEAQSPQGVVGVARVIGAIRPGMLDFGTGPSAEQRKWWAGDVGWVLDDVRALRTPIACKGAQGLWRLPDDVERQVREQLAEAA